MDKDNLFVTFPVDLGNRTLEKNYRTIFKDDMTFFRFSAKHGESIDAGNINMQRSLLYRVEASMGLRKIVHKHTKLGKKILFHGISPALFSYGTWKKSNTAIVLDWTRSLYPWIQGKKVKKDYAFYIHRKILHSCKKILCHTDAVYQNLREVYGVPESSLFRVPVAFLLDHMSMLPRVTHKIPKVLFVGGDLKRKGADVLINGFKNLLHGRCSLSMVTNDQTFKIPEISWHPGVKFGSMEHRQLFRDHDILILPTRMDSYPQAIAEAAAAGLAVITTKFALGAPDVIDHGVSGYIAQSPEESIDYLNKLLLNWSQIDKMKENGYRLMQERFSASVIRSEYLKIIYS